MTQASDLLRMLEPGVRPAGAPGRTAQPPRPIEGQSFDQMLRSAQRGQPLVFSAHAQQRLQEAGLNFGPTQLDAIAEAAARAHAKGGRETLMLVEGRGLIVNVPNRTVVTVLDQSRMNDGVVTNIDSAVWVQSPTTEPNR
jgi:flagellar operon protein